MTVINDSHGLGSIVPVAKAVVPVPGSGFLHTVAGSLLEILYLGRSGEDDDWAYARHVAGSEPDAEGWIHRAAIFCEGSVVRAVKDVDAVPDSGYLQTTAGALLEILFIDCSTDDTGWAYAKYVDELCAGVGVRLDGLQVLELNGQKGEIVAPASKAGRWNVKLDGGETKSVQSKNLIMLEAQPAGWICISAIEALDLVCVVQNCTAEPGSGYLQSEIGMHLEILHRGISQEDEGWLYARNFEGDGPHAEGWFPSSAAQTCSRYVRSVHKAHLEAAYFPQVNNESKKEVSCPILLHSGPDAATIRDTIASAATPARERDRSSKPSPCEHALSSAENVGLVLLARHAHHDLPWKYPVQDVSRRSFVGHLPQALSRRDAQKCLQNVMDGMDDLGWDRPKGGMGQISRGTKWMVRTPCSCGYRYGGMMVQAVRFPQWMDELLAVCMPLCGLSSSSAWPNSCNLNCYADGSDSIDWHADDEALFQGYDTDCRIISLSLGAERTFEVRLAGATASSCQLRLASGDICTMEGLTQRHYEHRVPKGGKSTRLRVNLTWRWVKAHDKRTCWL